MGALTETLNLHATTLVIGECGVLIRGPSGSGKTRLALGLMAEGRRDGRFARLVADDRTLVVRHGDRLVARPHPALAGLAECRGLGIVGIEHEPACVLGLVIDLVSVWPARLPDPEALSTLVAGVALPRLAMAAEASAGTAMTLLAARLEMLTAPS